MYVSLKQHSEEVYSFARIQSAACKILRRVQEELKVAANAWSLHALTNVKTIAQLYDKEAH